MNKDILTEVSAQVSGANNVLVAVSTNPSVDELSAAIGLTLLLNKLGKHATTVFSGKVPSVLEFLQPEQAIEPTTDSLRDFIIALDRSKADKLRYKVEDDVVRVFITPYKTKISEQDLEFSLGEFNVDVVVALGIEKRDEVDKAITAHGRILHDATVLVLTTGEKRGDFGAINWNEANASSLCEMVTAVTYEIGGDKLNGQMATALLTGIIAKTDRFRNELTSPLSLDFASRLMRAGANQKLIADELDAAIKLHNAQSASPDLPSPVYGTPEPLDEVKNDGSLQIDHSQDQPDDLAQEQSDSVNIHIDEQGTISGAKPADQPDQDLGLQYEDIPPADFIEENLPPEPIDQPLDQPEQPSDDKSKHQDRYLRSDSDQQPVKNADPRSAEEHLLKKHGRTIQPLHPPDYPTKPLDSQQVADALRQAEQESQSSASQPPAVQKLIDQARQEANPKPEPASTLPSTPPTTIVPEPITELPQENQSSEPKPEQSPQPSATPPTAAIPKPVIDSAPTKEETPTPPQPVEKQGPAAPPPVPPPIQPQFTAPGQ